MNLKENGISQLEKVSESKVGMTRKEISYLKKRKVHSTGGVINTWFYL